MPPVGTIRSAHGHQTYEACDGRRYMYHDHDVNGLSKTFFCCKPEKGQAETASEWAECDAIEKIE